MIEVSGQFSATDLNKGGGRVLDTALTGVVRITRRDQHFVLLREEHLDALLEAAREDRPQTLAELLDGYDREKIGHLTAGFLEGGPIGRELL